MARRRSAALRFTKPAIERSRSASTRSRGTCPSRCGTRDALFAIALGGILPFGAVCIELLYHERDVAPPGTPLCRARDSQNLISSHQIYYVFGFLMIVRIVAAGGEIDEEFGGGGSSLQASTSTPGAARARAAARRARDGADGGALGRRAAAGGRRR